MMIIDYHSVTQGWVVLEDGGRATVLDIGHSEYRYSMEIFRTPWLCMFILSK